MSRKGSPEIPLAYRIKLVETVLAGTPVPTVAADVGTVPHNINRWLRQMGIRMSIGGRYSTPHNRVLYAPELTQPIPGNGNGRRLQLADRLMILVLLDQGETVAQIARTIGFSRSTIYRELARRSQHTTRQCSGKIKDTRYSGQIAQYLTDHDRARPKPRLLDKNPRLRALVVDRLTHGHSPEQIAIRLPIDYPDDLSMRISHETIYQELYRTGPGCLRDELEDNPLRSGRAERKPASKLPGRGYRAWLQGALLSDRDMDTITDHAARKIAGHWEGDLVVGPDNSAVITLVDRASRYTLLGKLPGNRESATTVAKLARMVSDLPADWFRSITWDQGTEMARHAEFTRSTGCPVFFCDPHSPWQRPTNENFNRQLRWEYPKGTDFNKVTEAELRDVQDRLNARPRKVLGGYTPQEQQAFLVNRPVALTA